MLFDDGAACNCGVCCSNVVYALLTLLRCISILVKTHVLVISGLTVDANIWR